MENRLERWFEESDLPGRIRLPAEVVVHRTKLSPAELVAIRKSGTYRPPESGEELCELEVAGQVLATGRIVRKGKEFFFKVSKISDKGGAQ